MHKPKLGTAAHTCGEGGRVWGWGGFRLHSENLSQKYISNKEGQRKGSGGQQTACLWLSSLNSLFLLFMFL